MSELKASLQKILKRKPKKRLRKVTGSSAFHEVLKGDSARLLKKLPRNSVDAYVTDPPAGIGFMGKGWDVYSNKKRNPREAFIAAMTKIFRRALRVLKPGAHALVWAIPRTSHWTASALEDAGFEIRDVIVHIQAQGMAKGLSIAHAVEATLSTGKSDSTKTSYGARDRKGKHWSEFSRSKNRGTKRPPLRHARSRSWSGWGTHLRPLAEHWILARKPIEGTVAQNVLKWGVGGLHIDACRFGGPSPSVARRASSRATGKAPVHDGESAKLLIKHNRFTDRTSPEIYMEERPSEMLGRWPPNMVFTHHERCSDDSCVEGCPLRELEAQKPGASKNYRCFTVSKTDLLARFRYSGKITPKERTHDSEVDNNHPTVKTVALMQWLISLITPPKGVVLDTFNGSGSTGVSCLSLSDLQPSYIGMERDPLYVKVTRKRFRHTVRHLRKSSHGMKTLF